MRCQVSVITFTQSTLKVEIFESQIIFFKIVSKNTQEPKRDITLVVSDSRYVSSVLLH